MLMNQFQIMYTKNLNICFWGGAFDCQIQREIAQEENIEVLALAFKYQFKI